MGGAKPPVVEPPLWPNIPPPLQQLPQWLLWAWCQRDDGEWTKPPFQATGRLAKANNPETWCSFEQARARLERSGSRFHGIGFVPISINRIVGVDFDGCLDENFNIIIPRVLEFVAILDTYVEVSPSLTGLRLFAGGELPPGRRKAGDYECYSHHHYVTVTGRTWPPGSPPKPIAERQEQILAVYAAIFTSDGNGKHTEENSAHSQTARAQSNYDFSDSALLLKARNFKNGPNFITLYDHGDWQAAGFSSRSEADLSLCIKLAFLTNKDPERIDTLFRGSALYRDKWEREDYRSSTIGTAIAKCGEGYKPHVKKTTAKKATGPTNTEQKPGKDKVELWSELAAADRFLAAHREDTLFSADHFHLWDGCRYCLDETEQVPKLGEDIVRAIYNEATAVLAEAAEKEKLLKSATPEQKPTLEFEVTELKSRAAPLESLAREMSRRNRVDGALKFARSHIALTPDELDAACHLLNVRNGTVDLKTGKLRPHSRVDRITKLIDIDYIPDAKGSRWYQFLLEIFNDDLAVCEYVQKAVGYSFTAEQREKAFWFLWGDRDSGKTTFCSILLDIAADYGQKVPKTLFLKDRPSIPSDIARLRGVRFAYASETGKGRSFDAEKLKELTGAEHRIVARHMYHEEFEFTPCHHLWLASNYRPHARADDAALWKRLRLIRFPVIFEEVTEENPQPTHEMDKQLFDTLLAEREGILAWIIEGARLYYAEELNEPNSIREATRNYRDDEDSLKKFISNSLIHGAEASGHKTKRSLVYAAYKFAMQGEKNILGKQHFNTELRDRYGFKEDHDAGLGDVWLNTKLRDGALPPTPPPGNKQDDFDF